MIEISGLAKRYGPHTVLDNIDFTVESGSIAAVVGRSGAGKSTLFRCVNLLERGTKYLHDPQVQKLIKVFLDPRVQPYLRTTQDPRLKDQLVPVSSSNN